MTRTRTLTRTLGIGAAALMAVPVGAQAADYQAHLSEAISSGAAGVSPTLTLTTKIDASGASAPVPTGSLRIGIATGHLAPSAWASLTAATPGTQIGTVQSDITGPDAMPLRVLAHGRDGAGQFVRAGISVPRATAAIIGTDTIPVTIRRSTGATQIVFAMDTHAAVGKLAAAGKDSTLQTVTLALRSTLSFAGTSHAFTLNPTKAALLTNAVAIQACGQPACTTLRASATTAGASVHLPKVVTINAPGTASYGYRYSLGGSARPGDEVTLQGLTKDGLVAARGTASVRPDGSFLIRTTLRSAFGDDGELALPAAGRYAVASVEGGNATVYGIASQDTHVSLVQPRFVLQRKAGDKLHFAVRVPGADAHVRVSIKLGTKTLASGFATTSGRFFKTVAKPSATGNLRVVASVPGADTAISAATPLSR
jgi:hypothetical protein